MRLGYGTYGLQSQVLLELAYNEGIRHFDTADIYTLPEPTLAEKWLGARTWRDEVEIGTKVGLHFDRRDVPWRKWPRLLQTGRFCDFRPEYIFRALDDSLERLNNAANYVYLHGFSRKFASYRWIYWLRDFLWQKRIILGASVNSIELACIAADMGLGIVQIKADEWIGGHWDRSRLEKTSIVIREPIKSLSPFTRSFSDAIALIRDACRLPRPDIVLFGSNDSKHITENVEIWESLVGSVNG